MSYISYEYICPFKGYYFEDSYVLEIRELPERLEFELDVVLTPNHELYKTPDTKEQHCYRKATLIFQDIADCKWSRRSSQKFVDVNGDIDLGNIDTFHIDKNHNKYELSGDWGHLILIAQDVDLSIKSC